jgi:hypothetical protein
MKGVLLPLSDIPVQPRYLIYLDLSQCLVQIQLGRSVVVVLIHPFLGCLVRRESAGRSRSVLDCRWQRTLDLTLSFLSAWIVKYIHGGVLTIGIIRFIHRFLRPL